MQVHTYQSPFGKLVSSWTSCGLYALEFASPKNSSQSACSISDSRAIALGVAIQEYFHTGQFAWELNDLDWSNISEFYSRVLRRCHQIPSGKTMTYGELAQAVSSPKAARAVGAAMAANRWPLLIPCHRVVGSAGRLTGYSGRGGLETKRKLLAMEREFAADASGLTLQLQ